MHYIILLIAGFISFFILHSLSKDDFVLIRKNISPFQMFDLAILALVVSFICGRLFYVFDTRNIEIVHILRFFYILKFGGFSFIGAIIGFNVGVFLLFRGKSAFKRMFDMYSISFFPIFLFSVFITPASNYKTILIGILVPILLVAFLLFLKVHKEYKLRDGSISALTLLFVSGLCLYIAMISSSPVIIWRFSLSALLSMGVLVSSVVFFIFNERHMLKLRHGK